MLRPAACGVEGRGLACITVAHDEAGRDAVVETKGGPTEPHEPGASGSNDAAEGHEGGVRNSTASNAPVNPTDGGGEDETPTSRVARISRRLSMRKHRVSTERDMEILKLKSCGHWFHARCLSSWFLIDRYDCPVCRKNYWHGRARPHAGVPAERLRTFAHGGEDGTRGDGVGVGSTRLRCVNGRR